MRFRTFFRKYKIHLFILFIAILIWIHVKTDKIYDEIFYANIVPTNINPEYVISNHYTKSVPVRFQGKGKRLIALRNTDIDVLVDLNETSKTKIVERLNLNSVRISPPIVNMLPLEFVEKDTIHFALDALLYDMVDVEPRILIKPKAGYTQVGKLEIFPHQVTVSGPGKKIKQIEVIQTDSFSIFDADKDVSGMIALVNPFPGEVVLNSTKVKYSADIQEIGTQVFQDIPVQITNKPKDLKITIIPSTLSLKITGGVELVSSIDRNDIFAYIDFQRYNRTKDHSLPATIKIPEEVTVSDVFPPLFEIKIE